jgi:hypothetical protein
LQTLTEPIGVAVEPDSVIELVGRATRV